MEKITLTKNETAETAEVAEATRKARAESFKILAEIHAEIDPIINAKREAEE